MTEPYTRDNSLIRLDLWTGSIALLPIGVGLISVVTLWFIDTVVSSPDVLVLALQFAGLILGILATVSAVVTLAYLVSGWIDLPVVSTRLSDWIKGDKAESLRQKSASICAYVGRVLVSIGVYLWTYLLVVLTRLSEWIQGGTVIWLRRRLDEERTRPTFHRAAIGLQRRGHGDQGRRFHSLSIPPLIAFWFIGTWGATYASLPNEAGFTDRAIESAYRTVLTLGGSDNLLMLEGDEPKQVRDNTEPTDADDRSSDKRPDATQAEDAGKGPAGASDQSGDGNQDATQTESLGRGLEVMRWVGLLLPFWIALPPLFRWLIRITERGNAEHSLSQHYVILGFGQVGVALAHDILREADERPANDATRPYAVVIVDNGAPADQLASIRRRGALVIEQSAEDNEVLEHIGAHRAKGILVATGVSSRNIDITGRLAKEIPKKLEGMEPSRDGPTRLPELVPHIAERRLMDWVSSKAGESWRLGPKEPNGTRKQTRPKIRPFSADQTAVRRILAHRPVSDHARLRSVRRPHIVVLGFDSVADWLLPQLFQAGRTIDIEPPRVTVVLDCSETGEPGKDSTGSGGTRDPHPFPSHDDPPMQKLRDHLQLDLHVCHYDFDSLDRSLLETVTPVNRDTTEFACQLTGERPPFGTMPEDLAESSIKSVEDPVTTVFVCFGEDRRNLDVALQLRELVTQTRLWRAPVFVRLFEDSGLDDILARTELETDLQRVIDDFGQDKETCTRREIFEPPRDYAAEQAHQLYELKEALAELAEIVTAHYDNSSALVNTSEISDQPGPEEVAQAVRAQYGSSYEGKPTGTNEGYWISTVKYLRQWLLKQDQTTGEIAQKVRTLCGALAPKKDNDTQRAPADRPWETLDFKYIVSNRDQVDHLPEKLRGLGYRAYQRDGSADSAKNRLLGPWPVSNRRQEPAVIFDNEIHSQREKVGAAASTATDNFPAPINEAAALEHDRWLVEKLAAGWRFGPERDDDRGLHHDLRPFMELNKLPSEQQKDRTAVVNIHSILAFSSATRDWHPECAVGFLVADSLRERDVEKMAPGWHVNTLHPILRAITELETDALERDFGHFDDSNSAEADNNESPSAPESTQAWAICAIADVGDDLSWYLVGQMSQWCGQRAENHGSSSGTYPFRAIVPHAGEVRNKKRNPDNKKKPYNERIATLITATPTTNQKATDWWAVDLLPDGLPVAATASVAELKWPPNDPDGSTANWTSQEEINEQMGRLRNDFYQRFLQPRTTAYITERSDWLILVTPRDGGDGESVTSSDGLDTARQWRTGPTEVPAYFTSLPGDRRRRRLRRAPSQKCPDGWHLLDGNEVPNARIGRSDLPLPVHSVEIDRKHRLVKLVVEPPAQSENAQQSSTDNTSDD